MATYFISEQYLKDNTTINANVDPQQLTVNIPLAESMYIQNILGSKLFDSLKASFIAQTLTADEITLVSLIKPALAYRTYEISLPFLHIQTRNKGTVQQSSEYAQQSDLSGMKYLREQIKDFAEFYEAKLVTYLCNYGNLYPDYTTPDANGTLPDYNTPFDSDLFIPLSGNTDWRKYYGN